MSYLLQVFTMFNGGGIGSRVIHSPIGTQLMSKYSIHVKSHELSMVLLCYNYTKLQHSPLPCVQRQWASRGQS